MKPNTSMSIRLLAGAGFIATAFAGWQLAGGSSASNNPTEAVAAENGRTAKTASRTERSARNAGPPPQARRQLAAIRALKSPQERMRATIALAYSLPASELGDWIDKRWFQSEPGFDLTLFNKIVNQRWQEEDPQGKLKLAMEAGEGYSSTALAAWAKQDPAALVAWFKENPNPGLERQSLLEIAKVDPALALSRMRELSLSGIEDGYGDYYSRQALQELAAKSPAALEAALASLPNKLRRQAEGMLFAQKLKTDPAGELRALMQKSDGMGILERALNGGGTTAKLGDLILNDLASIPESWRSRLSNLAGNLITKDNAEKWFQTDFAAAGFTDAQAKSVRMTALNQLTYQNPEQALKLMEDIDLDPQVRKNLIQNLFSYNREPEKAEKLLAMLSSDEERDAMKKFAEANNARQNGEQQEVKAETAAEWLQQVQDFDPAKGGSYAYVSILSQWDKDKLAAVASGFRDLPPDKKPAVAKMLAGGENDSRLDPSLRGEAIRYLLSNEPAAEAKPDHESQGGDPFSSERQSPSQLASALAVHWGVKDPDAASQWVQTLPDGTAKLWAQKNLALNWSQYDPEATKTWLSTLPATARTEVEKFLKDPNR